MTLPKVTLDIKIGAKEIVALVLGVPWAYKKDAENGYWYIHDLDTGEEVIYGPNGEKYRREL